MESVAEVASAEEEASRVIELRKFPLSAYGLEREDGMLVGRPVKNARVRDPVIAVQGDEVIPLLGDALQGIHPIMGGCALMSIWPLLDTEIP